MRRNCLPSLAHCCSTWSPGFPNHLAPHLACCPCRPITHQRSGGQGLRLSMEERPSPRRSAESAAAAAGGSPSKAADPLAAQLGGARLSDSANGPSAAAAAAAAGGSSGSEAAAGCSSSSSGSGTHVCVSDARNEDVLVGIRDGVLDTFDLVWRPQVGVTGGGGGCTGTKVWVGDCLLSHSPAPHRPTLHNTYTPPPPHTHTRVLIIVLSRHACRDTGAPCDVSCFHCLTLSVYTPTAPPCSTRTCPPTTPPCQQRAHRPPSLPPPHIYTHSNPCTGACVSAGQRLHAG